MQKYLSKLQLKMLGSLFFETGVTYSKLVFNSTVKGSSSHILPTIHTADIRTQNMLYMPLLFNYQKFRCEPFFLLLWADVQPTSGAQR